MNGKPTLPRKLTLAMGGAYLLKDIQPTETVKLVCVAAVVITGLLIQGFLDNKGDANVQKTENLIDPVPGAD